jgi:hypothetical protein
VHHPAKVERGLNSSVGSNPTVSANKKRPLKGRSLFAETVVLKLMDTFEPRVLGTLTEARAWREATRRKTTVSAITSSVLPRPRAVEDLVPGRALVT